MYLRKNTDPGLTIGISGGGPGICNLNMPPMGKFEQQDRFGKSCFPEYLERRKKRF
jgi:hypothetical protein